jgi:hypothetical protein
MTALAPISEKIGKLIRMLGSDRDGEVLAAVQAIRRTLHGAGHNFHVLAEAVEKANGSLSEGEMRKLYEAGFEDGRRAAENSQPVAFCSVDDASDWHEMALWCQQHSGRLGPNEVEFVNDMASRTVWRNPTEKQGKWLRSIYYRLGGRA